MLSRILGAVFLAVFSGVFVVADEAQQAEQRGRAAKGPPPAIQEIEGQWEEWASGSHIHFFLGDRIGLLDQKSGTWQHGRVRSQSPRRVIYLMENQAVLQCAPIGPSQPGAPNEMAIKVFNPGGTELRHVKVLQQTKTKAEVQRTFPRGFPH
jgi:hypothetical protein